MLDLLDRRVTIPAGDVELEGDLALPAGARLIEEPGALEEVARLARDWFLRHLPASGARA